MQHVGMEFVLEQLPYYTADGDIQHYADFLDKKFNATFFGTTEYRLYNTNATMEASKGRFWTSAAPTLPIVHTYSAPYSVLLRRSTRDQSQGWRLFAPFELSLWLAIIGLILVFGLGMALLNIMGRALDGQILHPRAITVAIVRSQYDALACVLGGEDHEWMV